MDLKKTKKILNSLFAIIVVFLLLCFLTRLFLIPAIAVTVVYVVVYWKNWRCPYCKGVLGRGIGSYCPHCGKDSGVELRF